MACLEVHARSAGRHAAYRLPASPADHLEQGTHGVDEDALLVPTRALLVRPEKERAVVRQSGQKLDHMGCGVAEVHHGQLGGGEVRSPDTETRGLDAAPDLESHPAWRSGIRA